MKRPLSLAAATLAATLVGAAEPAAPGDAPGASLEAMTAYAEAHNPGLRAADARWQAARACVSMSETLPDPRFQYSYFLESVETRVGPQKQRFNVSQTIPAFGKRGLRGEVADESAQAANAARDAAYWALRADVTRTYCEYAYRLEAVRIAGSNLDLLKTLEAVAQEKFRSGTMLTGVIQAQLELSRLEDRLTSLRDGLTPAAAALNAALNRAPAAPLPALSLPEPQAVDVNESALLSRLAAGNPELTALGHRVAGAEAGVRLARRAGWPDVMIGVDYLQTDPALMPNTPDSGKDPVMATIGINLPIWQGTYRSEREAARQRLAAAKASREEQANALAAQLKESAYRFRDAERKMNLYRDTLLPQVEEALNVAEQAYRAGRGDFMTLIDAERQRLDLHLSLARARADREIHRAMIERLIGGALPRPAGATATRAGDDGKEISP